MTYWFVFYESELLLKRRPDGTYTVPTGDRCPVATDDSYVHTITIYDDHVARTLATAHPPKVAKEYEMCQLRESYDRLPAELYIEAGKCREILYWDATTQYCGTCGAPMRMNTEISKICDCCHREIWPQLATAVICLVHKGEDILLVRAHNFRSDFYGLVAGFVETGETLEQAVEREITEETGLKVKNIVYFGSQPWPYPNTLMVGFYAEYDSGDIRIQQEELKEAAWFGIDHLPTIPQKLSIARRLIDNWLMAKGRTAG